MGSPGAPDAWIVAETKRCASRHDLFSSSVAGSASGGGSARATLGALLFESERDRPRMSTAAARRLPARRAGREILFARRDRRWADELASVLVEETRGKTSGAIEGIADTSEVTTDIMDVMVAMRDVITPVIGDAGDLRQAPMGAHPSPVCSCDGGVG